MSIVHQPPPKSVRQLLDTPWKAMIEVRRQLLVPWARCYFALHGITWHSSWRVYGLPLVRRHRGSRIRIGSHMRMRNWFTSNPLGVNHRTILTTWSRPAVIEIGDDVGLTGVTICAQEMVKIGSHVLIGANTTIVDTDFHPLSIAGRYEDAKVGNARAVVIEDNVFIGMSAIIMKGSHIGEGSVVGAGSVVSGTVPPHVVVAGNPARVVREIEREGD